MQSHAGTCPVCGAQGLRPILELRRVPVHCNVLLDSREAARSAARADLHLVLCEACTHVFNAWFEPDLTRYLAGYENSLHFSPRFREYASALAARLVDRYGLRGRVIVEIGSGDGQFLRELCMRGQNQGFGFDPGGTGEAATLEGGGVVTFSRESFAEAPVCATASLVCFRHVLEHLADPVGFLRLVRGAVGDRRDAVIYCEVPNADRMYADRAVWDVLYEHVSYFTPASLATAFGRAGFDVRRLETDFAGQFLSVDASPTASEPERIAEPYDGPSRSALIEGIERFGADYRAQAVEWGQFVGRAIGAGQRVVVWGAGSKGVMFLNALGLGHDVIPFVVDINPRKHGRFLPQTGQRVVPPAHLVSYRPDVVVLMNSVYEAEVRSTLETLSLRPRLVCPS